MKNIKLSTAVLLSINELENEGEFSAYDITSLIRNKCNNQEWAISDLTSDVINGVTTFYIDHISVRDLVVELYTNGVLAKWKKEYNNAPAGPSYTVYKFDAPIQPKTCFVVPTSTAASSRQANLYAIPSVFIGVENKIHSYINSRLAKGGGKPTIKQIQSRLKKKGIKTKDLYNFLKGSNKYIISTNKHTSKCSVYV